MTISYCNPLWRDLNGSHPKIAFIFEFCNFQNLSIEYNPDRMAIIQLEPLWWDQNPFRWNPDESDLKTAFTIDFSGLKTR